MENPWRNLPIKFVSRREQRLWTMAILLVLTIYSTLGVVRTWLEVLEASGWGLNVFLLSCGLILTFMVTQGLRACPNRREMAVAFGIGLVYFLTLKSIESVDERIHVIMYGVVALLIHAALLERSAHDQRIPAGFMIAIGITVTLGTIDELLQLLMPDRVFDVRDILFDALASVMAILSNSSLRWARSNPA